MLPFIARLLATLLLTALVTIVSAQEADSVAATFTEKGADNCLRCHDPGSEAGIKALFFTPHGQAVSGTPFGAQQCETCHGPGSEHAKRIRRDEQRAPLQDFRHDAKNATAINSTCLACHADEHRAAWFGSAHEESKLSCSDCHRIHRERDPVLQTRSVNEVCGQCHARVIAESKLLSSHPIRNGGLACSDCHAAHGSSADAELKQQGPNANCFSCHADKRGPFLWEHEPVSEDCGLCHRPHGSNHRALLTQTPPLLCQSCHDDAGHPSLAYSAGVAAASGSIASFARLRGCTNCHSQVHGSNHPSGAPLNR